MLLGIPVGYCIGYFLKKPKLGLEIGTISGMIIIMPLHLKQQLFDFIYLGSYVSMIIGIFVGKFVGMKFGKYFNEENENTTSEHTQMI
jgi:Na+/H+ antiporter NhaC